MKAVSVNEFERGLDPKEVLAVGEYRKIYRPIPWRDLPLGFYKAFNDIIEGEMEVTFFEIKKDGINQITYWLWEDKDGVLGNHNLELFWRHNISFKEFDEYKFSYIQKIKKAPSFKRIGNKDDREVYILESVNFQRGLDPKEVLEIGEYRNIYKPIPWDDLSDGFYKVVNETDRNVREVSFIKIKNGQLIQITYWAEEDSEGKLHILRSYGLWTNMPMKRFSDFDNYGFSYIKKLKKAPSFKIDREGNEDDSQNKNRYIVESVNFQRGLDPKKALRVGMSKDWKIWIYDNASYIDEINFYGTLDEVRKETALALLRNWDYTAYRRKPNEDIKFWASINQYNEEKGGWEEEFENRVRLKEVDIKELRFRNNLVIKKDD